MRATFGKLERGIKSEIRRVTRLAKSMGIKLSVVSRMMILEGDGALVVMPIPRQCASWYQLGEHQLYEFLYARAYRRRSADYGEPKKPVLKSFTRREVYAQWDELFEAKPKLGVTPLSSSARSIVQRINLENRSRYSAEIAARHLVASEAAKRLLERLNNVYRPE